MPVNLLSVSLFVHISFVAVWLFTIPITTIIERAANAAANKDDKYRILGLVEVNAMISLVSAILVFATGAIMTTILDAWAPDGSFWLEAKQTVWLILLIAILVLMRPQFGTLKEQMTSDASEDEVMSTYKAIKIRGHILTAFILLNLFLATTKPF